MIQSISIKNYRGIKNLELDNFRKYNFFVGDNGSCKTAVMEALCSALPKIFTGIIHCAENKGLQLTEKNIDSIFFGADTNNEIEFILNKDIKTIIKKDWENNIDEINAEKKELVNNLLKNSLNEIGQEKILYNLKKLYKDKVYLETNFIPAKNGIETNFRTVAKEYFDIDDIVEDAIFISDFTKYRKRAAKTIKELIENKKTKEIIEILNIFEPDIDEIASDGTEILIGKKNIKKLIPLSAFGNGLLAFIDIISCFIGNEKKVIFIDEIETGIHYINFPKLINILIKLSSDRDIQLFITTHSKEILKEFYEYLRDSESSQEDICLYRFQK